MRDIIQTAGAWFMLARTQFLSALDRQMQGVDELRQDHDRHQQSRCCSNPWRNAMQSVR